MKTYTKKDFYSLIVGASDLGFYDKISRHAYRKAILKLKKSSFFQNQLSVFERLMVAASVHCENNNFKKKFGL